MNPLKLRILVIKTDLTITIEDDFDAWKKYELERLGLDITIDYATCSLRPSYAPINAQNGFADVLQKVRATNLVPKATYHAVIFVYDCSNAPSTIKVANFTHKEQIYDGTDFIEIATTRPWDTHNDVFRVVTHEARHMYVNRIRRRGISVADVMDATLVDGKMISYLKEWDPYAKDGNRAIQDTYLKPFIKYIVMAPELTMTISKLVAMFVSAIRQLQGIIIKR